MADRAPRASANWCTELCTHTAIEKKVFYPACKNQVEKDVLEEEYVEHDGTTALFAQLIRARRQTHYTMPKPMRSFALRPPCHKF